MTDSGDVCMATDVELMLPFEHTDIMTTDEGILIKMIDGSKFQVTVVQSRKAR
jgi:hypothetical protein